MALANKVMRLDSRHIQDFHNATNLQPHWGYVGRVLPCKNDAGSCRYLDTVYHAHDVSMLYTFVLWAVLGGILLSWATIRLVSWSTTHGRADVSSAASTAPSPMKLGFVSRVRGAAAATIRSYLLPEFAPRMFRHATRLQVLIIVVLTSYLTVFSFVGLVYGHWVTPIKGITKHNYRSTLGPWSDRIGALAYALTPFTVALATRESILSLLTGVPYQHFNFLHIWTGRIIYIQGTLHTIAWTIVEAKLYQPQPKVYKAFIRQPYMIWGCFAMAFLSWLFIMSFKSVIRRTGYEFFRKTHYLVALLYIGSCWGHWYQLKCWMIASFGIYAIDRAVRLLRVALIHLGYQDPAKGFGFHPAHAEVRTFVDGDATVVRLDFEHPHSSWEVGQHFHLCFPALTIWQSHPMTPMSLPSPSGKQRHTYIIRALGGETMRLAKLALPTLRPFDASISTPVILTGPSAVGIHFTTNTLAIAGGTGISFALPLFVSALNRVEESGRGAVYMVWVIRESKNTEWIRDELLSIKTRLAGLENIDARVQIYVTREAHGSSDSRTSSEVEKTQVTVVDNKAVITSEKADVRNVITSDSLASLTASSQNYSVCFLNSRHPDFTDSQGVLVEWESLAAVHGGTHQVVASGPAGMGRDLRAAVAVRNCAGKAFRAEGGNVKFHWDDRMA